MKIINKKFTPASFVEYVQNLPFHVWNRKIDKLVFHHTSSQVEIWQGSASLLHYWNLYRSRGWKVGPHIFVAPDGIWLFTDMRWEGKHAGPHGNPGSIGIEVVGRYVKKPPSEKELCKNLAVVTRALLLKFGLDYSDIRRHVDFDLNTFCSAAIDRDWLIENMKRHTT